jgi:hypothetical protein
MATMLGDRGRRRTISLKRLEEILNLLYHAHEMAESPDFKAIWLTKAREIQRSELAETKLNQQEGYSEWH